MRGLEITSEDAYVDCADRERVEWMDCDPPAFDVTRVAMAGPAADGKKVFCRPALVGRDAAAHGLHAATRRLGEGPHLFRPV